jgi:hypothetical protein
VECPACGRPIAAGPVAGRVNKGRVWRHDAPGQPRLSGGELVSCGGSLRVVDLPAHGSPAERDAVQESGAGARAGTALPLF